jgi:hypothetical protein
MSVAFPRGTWERGTRDGPAGEIMAERKAFLLRIDPEVLDAVQRWANDDLRSLNGQIEFLLRRALQQAGRVKEKGKDAHSEPEGQPAP